MCIHRNARHRAHKRARRFASCAEEQTPLDSLSADEERLEEQLADPLYQLLVCHTIFCRQIEEKFTRLPRNPNPQHRTMRRPHQRTPQHP